MTPVVPTCNHRYFLPLGGNTQSFYNSTDPSFGAALRGDCLINGPMSQTARRTQSKGHGPYVVVRRLKGRLTACHPVTGTPCNPNLKWFQAIGVAIMRVHTVTNANVVRSAAGNGPVSQGSRTIVMWGGGNFSQSWQVTAGSMKSTQNRVTTRGHRD